MIHFPVLRKIKIENYQLYRNDLSDGLEHSFDGGVHLIVGINGLGKTTLLNAIYRLLVGPNDAPKDGQKTLGSSKNELTSWRRKKFFSSRVKDGALNATIEGLITFGEREIKVKRKLSNLEIINLSVDGETLDASQDIYEEKIEELSGLPSYIDFFSVVKFLIFFLEDRSDLIWDHRSQFEIFRILFFDREAAQRASKYRDEARSADSKYRNLNASVNKIKDELAQLTSEETDTNRKQYTSALASLQGIEDKLNELNDERSELENNIIQTKVSIAKSRRDFDEYKFGIEEAQHTLLAEHFPNLDETVKILISNLSSGGGCFVCGNESDEVSEVIEKSLENKCCPVCSSDHENQENITSSTINPQHLETSIRQLQSKSLEALHDFESQQEILLELHSENERLLNIISETSEEQLKWYRKVQAIEKALPDEDTNTEELVRQLKIWQTMLVQYDDIRRKQTQAYKMELASQEAELASKLEQVKARFEHYCTRLLAEKVMLKKDFYEGPLGQGGEDKVTVPFFKVYMTSGVHTESPELRESHEQVSESQREFIDLAFRLALFDIVTEEENSPAMVIMETPESSLDSIFMHEISSLFRSFANKCDGKNLFLASTNLNQSEMISSLLGISTSPEHLEQTRSQRIMGQPGVETPDDSALSVTPQDKRESHIINLLKISAPNAALVNHKEYYESLYNSAVYPKSKV